jgi:eukaryotic-like serine/threonine-protein kinase
VKRSASADAARGTLHEVEGLADQSVTRAGTDSEAELEGRQLGDFVLHECIGAGGFATVYRCEQTLLGREAVVKVLHNRLRTSEVVFQRFTREARLASRLDHPYAAHVYAFGVEPEDGLAWIAMEFVHGTSLEKWLVERGPLPLDQLVTFFEHVAEVVQNAHDHGIIHRDLKPSNVMMIEYSGRVFPKLLDFGIAKLVDDAATEVLTDTDARAPTMFPGISDSGNNLTQANATLGSPPYMSPEQWRDPLSVGPRSDLYSLAVMAYEALTGRQPFTGATIAAIAEAHCSQDVPPVGEGFPIALDHVFQRALAKEPADRPASPLAFAGELRAAANASHTEPSITPPRSITAGYGRKRRLWPLVVCGAALVTGGVAAYLLMAGAGGEHDPLPPAAIAHAVETAPPPPASAPAAPGPAAAAPAQPAAAPAQATVVVEIESTPRSADVFRLPSETKVGTTPWRAELPSEAGVQVFVVRKSGYGDRQVEIDLRTGGTQSVKLARVVHRPPPAAAPAATTTPASTVTGPIRHKGEPVDPFRTPKPQ